VGRKRIKIKEPLVLVISKTSKNWWGLLLMPKNCPDNYWGLLGSSLILIKKPLVMGSFKSLEIKEPLVPVFLKISEFQNH
jgi:hypothetical protein